MILFGTEKGAILYYNWRRPCVPPFCVITPRLPPLALCQSQAQAGGEGEEGGEGGKEGGHEGGEEGEAGF